MLCGEEKTYTAGATVIPSRLSHQPKQQEVAVVWGCGGNQETSACCASGRWCLLSWWHLLTCEITKLAKKALQVSSGSHPQQFQCKVLYLLWSSWLIFGVRPTVYTTATWSVARRKSPTALWQGQQVAGKSLLSWGPTTLALQVPLLHFTMHWLLPCPLWSIW